MKRPTSRPAPPPFSEKGFYLAEFRGRTLAIAGTAEHLRPHAAIEVVLKELEANGSRVILISTDRRELQALLGARVMDARSDRLEVAVWRAFAHAPRVGLVVSATDSIAARSREIALQLSISKLVWLDPGGGLTRPDGGRDSFVDRQALERYRASGERGELLAEIGLALDQGIPAVNLCSAEGLGDELFTYAGSGTLFTRERYMAVRRLGLDDFDAANDLVARGVAEGYLAPRSPDEVEQVLASGFGAFVENRHLAGIGALLLYEASGAGEIASLYTLTRFLGEGVGSHLVRHALERARELGCRYVFACTTSDRVAGFFEREGFRRVGTGEVPAEKWQSYDLERRDRVICLRCETGGP